MKLYSYPLSPWAARVRLSIYRKNLDVEIVPPPDGGMKGEAFLALNPLGQVPTLLLKSGFAIPESATILEYLEDAFPKPSLRPVAAEDLARARLFLRLPDIYFQNAPRVLLGMRDPAHRDAETVAAQMATLEKALGYIEHYLSGNTWAVGNAPSIADCALVPVVFVVSLVGMIYERPDLIGKRPKLSAYWQAAQQDPINARVIAEARAAIPKN